MPAATAATAGERVAVLSANAWAGGRDVTEEAARGARKPRGVAYRGFKGSKHRGT